MKTNKRRSQNQEKSVAKNFNAKTVVASGSKWFAKADVRNDKFLIECKTTGLNFYSLKATVWEKIEEEATRDHMRIPLMVIDLEDKDRVVVFNPDDFRKIIPHHHIAVSYQECKSCRISVEFLENWSDCYVWGRIFQICGKKKNVLCYTRIKDFEDYFKEELS